MSENITIYTQKPTGAPQMLNVVYFGSFLNMIRSNFGRPAPSVTNQQIGVLVELQGSAHCESPDTHRCVEFVIKDIS
jgi:hypothetical protein